MTEQSSTVEEVGYRKPPTKTRFKKGQSGNPKGRPMRTRKDIPYDHLLGQIVVVREDGRERRVTAAEAFLLHITKRGMEGDSASARASLSAIEDARSRRHACDLPDITIVWRSVSPGSVGCALDALGMAHKLNRHSENAKYQLQPWIVQLALSRLGDRRLSIAEQNTVVEATRTPHKVDWPDWWEVHPSS
ncbi:hypothetical protein GCM10022276_22740 [Sphingomonas limnosediminicola]|uniref:DUF5681 domain-containing protein n=1 Tax=Sphingomonas limnosediminicola TaxID=940133 RepID=A0ABP7LMG8_9SPHN